MPKESTDFAKQLKQLKDKLTVRAQTVNAQKK
jgi:hypothetical protein